MERRRDLFHGDATFVSELPEDRPGLAAVAQRRARGTGHSANRLVAVDDPLDARAADRTVELRVAVPSAAVVDAALAVAAERAGSGGGVVEALTSDPKDVGALATNLRAQVDVVRI